MTTVSTKNIRIALDTQLSSILTPLTVKLYTENTMAGKVGVPWVRSTLLGTPTVNATLGVNGGDRIDGLYQIDVFSPLGVGYAATADIVDAIVAAFTRRTLTSSGQKVILNTASTLPGLTVDDSMFCIPIRVSWFTYNTPNP